MKRLIVYAKPYWLHIILAAVASIGCSVANVLIIDILKQLIDKATAGNLANVWAELIIKAAFIIIVGLVSNYVVIAATGYFGAGILQKLRQDAVNHLMKTSPDFMERNNFGDIFERLSSDVETISGYMQTYFKDCLYVPIVVIVFSIYLIKLNFVLAVVCLIPLAVLVPVSIILLKPVKLAQAEYVKMLGLTNNNIQEAFDGADVIKAYNLQKSMKDKYYNELKKSFDISNKNDFRQYNIEPISVLVREAPTALALCVGGFLAFNGNLTIGMLIAFISAIQKINEPLVYAYQLVVRSQMAMVSVNRVFYLMDMPVEETKNAFNDNDKAKKNSKVDNDKAEPDKSCADKSAEEIFEFKSVSFDYHNQNEAGSEAEKRLADDKPTHKKVIDNLSFTIRKGEKIALVGASGSGKSTIIKLLCRQYEADSGDIFYYGQSYSTTSADSIRNDMALISQDTVIFPMTVLDNIRIGNPDLPREQIIQAARLAGCDEFVRALPSGYDTIMDERGGNLSGGQRQRIAIARAILKNAPVLLLDEPTSALDKETEKYITDTIRKISVNKTVITVAHRLPTIIDYDRIIVINAGNITECGTHNELMEIKGIYYKMYQEYKMSEVKADDRQMTGGAL